MKGFALVLQQRHCMHSSSKMAIQTFPCGYYVNPANMPGIWKWIKPEKFKVHLNPKYLFR